MHNHYIIQCLFSLLVSAALSTTVEAPNALVCYKIPRVCSVNTRFIWSRGDPEHPCTCPVSEDFDGPFTECVRDRCSDSDIIPQFSNGNICLFAIQNESLVHFECDDQYQCVYGQCFVRTLLASHKIILAGDNFILVLCVY